MHRPFEAYLTADIGSTTQGIKYELSPFPSPAHGGLNTRLPIQWLPYRQFVYEVNTECQASVMIM